MRILLLNPNTSESLTHQMVKVAEAHCSQDTEVVGVTAERGVPYIASRTEAAIAACSVLEMLAERHNDFDGAIVAAFADPGLGAARESFDIPVVGLAEAGMITACMVGKSFSIVTFSTSLGAWYRECVAWNGLTGRCASIRMLDQDFDSISNIIGEKEEALVRLANAAVVEDDADVIVLAGAPLSGLAERIRGRVPVPMIDCCAASIRQIETLVGLGLQKPTSGTFRRPGAKETKGLNTALADRIEHRS